MDYDMNDLQHLNDSCESSDEESQKLGGNHSYTNTDTQRAAPPPEPKRLPARSRKMPDLDPLVLLKGSKTAPAKPTNKHPPSQSNKHP